MYSRFAIVTRYLKYFLTASNGKGHGVHSPFVFEFITQVLNDDRFFYAFLPIEDLRTYLVADTNQLTIEAPDVKSPAGNIMKLGIHDIARSSGSSRKTGQLLFRIVNYYSPDSILVLGNSLGIDTAYLAAANTSLQLTTIQQDKTIAAMAMKHFQMLELNNINMLVGDYDQALARVIKINPKIGLVYIHVNTDYASTMKYFNQLLSYIQPDSILIFHNIHSSQDMEKAWEEIKINQIVTLTLDLFYMGIVLFRNENKVKQDFSIRF